MRKANRKAENLDKLGFHVIAPLEQIDKEKSFKTKVNIESIRKKVFDRIEVYAGREDYHEKENWFGEWFVPTLSKIDVACLDWEAVMRIVREEDIENGEKISAFYDKCVQYNRKAKQ